MSPDRRAPLPSETFYLLRCRACRVVYLKNPPPDIGRHYDSGYYAYQEPCEAHLSRSSWIYARSLAYPKAARHEISRPRSVLATVRYAVSRPRYEEELHFPPYRPGGRLLDVGCGSGSYLDLAKMLGWETYGVEVSPVAASRALARNHRVHTGQLLDAAFPDGFFHHIQFWHSLEHVSDPLGTLNRAHSVLADDGTLTIGVPNIDSLGARLFGNNWFHLDPPRHLFGFGRSSLPGLLIRAGFRICHMRTYSIPRDWVCSLHYCTTPQSQPVSARTSTRWETTILEPFCFALKLAGVGDLLYVTADRLDGIATK